MGESPTVKVARTIIWTVTSLRSERRRAETHEFCLVGVDGYRLGGLYDWANSIIALAWNGLLLAVPIRRGEGIGICQQP